ncbi:MAG: MBL fold metallo-hydrolase [Proteobacteria bacterium]|nr:MBL fold metallo-hydrolase [Pseudomonadota bacterium]
MPLTFLGAAGEVTGSRHLVEAAGLRLLVDCGLFQGGRDAAARNREPWGFSPRDIDAVVLTHAHLDHSGLLPRLVRDGFRGRVHATPATIELADLMLRDSAHLMAAEAARHERHGRRERELWEPVYGFADVDALRERFAPLGYGDWRELGGGARLRFQDAGHILGSAIVELDLGAGRDRLRLVLSGDLGQPGRPILRDPARIESADALVVESTYGDRNHKPLAATLDELVAAVDRTLRTKHGNVLVPAFAVGRTQELLYWFERLTLEGRLPEVDVFVDSPLAIEVTEITRRHVELFDEDARVLWAARRRGAPRPRIRFLRSVAESSALNRIEGGAVILAASGMCDGGRIKHHLRHHLASERTTVLITGYQAQGTLGRRLVNGDPFVPIFGAQVPVRAEIITLGGFSAHADQAALLDWLGGFRQPPHTWLVHGEGRASQALCERIRVDLHWPHCSVAARGERVELAAAAADAASAS